MIPVAALATEIARNQDGNLGRKPGGRKPGGETWGQTGRSLVFFDQYGNGGRIAARNERYRVTDLIIF